jgi:hypothetical protein
LNGYFFKDVFGLNEGILWLNKLLFLLCPKKLFCLAGFIDDIELLFVLLTVEL